MKLRHLFFIPLFLLTISLYTGNTLPNNSTKFNNSDTLEIQNIIKKQIDAFTRNDYETAYSYASDEIKNMFADKKIFKNMIISSYSILINPKNVIFEKPMLLDKNMVAQKVKIIGINNLEVYAVYTVTKNTQQQWRIAGCVLIKNEEIAA
tara:strand:- start:886 stop:1335 length:450 start_codon:yes stop_codon:yes gene_type:complete